MSGYLWHTLYCRFQSDVPILAIISSFGNTVVYTYPSTHKNRVCHCCLFVDTRKSCNNLLLLTLLNFEHHDPGHRGLLLILRIVATALVDCCGPSILCPKHLLRSYYAVSQQLILYFVNIKQQLRDGKAGKQKQSQIYYKKMAGCLDKSVFATCNRTHCQRYFRWIIAVLLGYSGFLHQWNWSSRYNLNIVKSDVKHHNPNP
jgi:hypothetical protein